MKAKSDGECDCGNPGITAGSTRVVMNQGRVVQCELCNPDLSNERDEEVEDALITVRVRVIGQRYAKPDGSFYIYVVELNGPDGQPQNLPDGTKRSFGLTGPIGSFTRDDIIMVSGKFGTDPKYGFQMKAQTAGQLAVRESEQALINFLSKFPQVGRVRATEMIRKFGGLEGCTEILDFKPERLTEINGITPERAAEIKEAYDKTAGYREFRLFATKLGLTEATIAAAIEEWGEQAQAVIQEDAFELLNLPRMSFKGADEVHTKLNKDPKDPSRCAAGVYVAIGLTCDEGHTYALDTELIGQGRGRAADEVRRLGLSPDEVETGLKILETEQQKERRGTVVTIPPRVVRENGRVYLAEVYMAEVAIPREMDRINNAVLPAVTPGTDVWGGMTPAAAQLDALKYVCDEAVVIITGGPGVGKTMVTKTILNVLQASGLDSALCAPTGKAAKRLEELTEREAMTLHRLLGVSDTSSDRHQIDAKVVLVDEASMVDTEMFAKLVTAVRTGTRLIIVGDVDQLPSIGPGRVLYDLINCGKYRVVYLTEIFRQKSDGESKRIPEVARDIRDGQLPDLHKKGTDVTFLPFDDAELLQQKIVLAVTEQLPNKLGVTPDEIQVIAPQKGELGKDNWPIGTKALNMALQEALNPNIGGPELHVGEGYMVRANDRIIHTKNDYDLGTMNGELGTVLRVEKAPFVPQHNVVTSFRTQRARVMGQCERCGGEGVIDGCGVGDNTDVFSEPCPSCVKKAKAEKATTLMLVDYGDRIVGYDKSELRQAQLAYALTCHKCQGSQYRVVVIPVHNFNAFMLTQPLIYTAITRATEYVLLIGQESRMFKAVKNRRGVERRTSLPERLATPVVEGVHALSDGVQTLPIPQPEIIRVKSPEGYTRTFEVMDISNLPPAAEQLLIVREEVSDDI